MVVSNVVEFKGRKTLGRAKSGADSPQEKFGDRNKRSKIDYTAAFEAFWEAYPTKPTMAKAAAFRMWQAKKCEPIADDVIHGARCYAEEVRVRETDPTYFKHASGWLSEKRWEGWSGVAIEQISQQAQQGRMKAEQVSARKAEVEACMKADAERRAEALDYVGDIRKKLAPKPSALSDEALLGVVRAFTKPSATFWLCNLLLSTATGVQYKVASALLLLIVEGKGTATLAQIADTSGYDREVVGWVIDSLIDGGWLERRSNPGKASTFKLMFPEASENCHNGDRVQATA